MRFIQLLPLVSLGSSFIIPEDHVFQSIEKSGQQRVLSSKNALDDALGKSVEAVKSVADNVFHRIHEAGCDVESWLNGNSFDDNMLDVDEDVPDHPNDPPRPSHPPHLPHPPHPPRPSHVPHPPHPPRPSHVPHPPRPSHVPHPPHPPHHGDGKPNLTVYELISQSKYTTKLAKLIDEYEDLVEALNGTKANYTIFAPVDSAFDKIPKHGKKPSKEFLKNLLLYHITDSLYPAGRVFHSYTIPTLYKPEHSLGHNQRITVLLNFKGLHFNFYSTLIATNIFATNGVIHGLDSILIPPPPVAAIISLLPAQFSTLELAFRKTGLYEKLNSTEYPHEGGTLFAPPNSAFERLGPKLNAFLFSKYGEKYLKALLQYHIVVNQTLYSDAFFDSTGSQDESTDTSPPLPAHYDLPTALKDRFLSVDVRQVGPVRMIKINDFAVVVVKDGVAADGVIQVVSNVIIPPKAGGGKEKPFWKGEPMSVEELKERLEPYVQEDMLEL